MSRGQQAGSPGLNPPSEALAFPLLSAASWRWSRQGLAASQFQKTIKLREWTTRSLKRQNCFDFDPWGYHKWAMRVSGKEQSKSGITLSGDYAGDTDRGQRARRRSHGVGPLGHCSGRPHTVPLGVTPAAPVFRGSHPCSLFPHGITYTKQKPHVIQGSDHRRQGLPAGSTLLPHSRSPAAPLGAPAAPRDRRARRLLGTGEHLQLLGTREHGGSGGQASTEAWERACGGRGLGPGASAESGDPNHRLPAELPPDSRWDRREWLFKASRVLSDLLYRTSQHHGWI